MATVAVASSLSNLCLKAIITEIDRYQNNIRWLPKDIKYRLLDLMCKRGLLNDTNISEVLARVNSDVKELDLSDCDISDLGLEVVCTCPRLAKIDLNSTKDNREGVTSRGIQNLSSHCKFLQIVSLRRCMHVDDISIVSIAQNCELLTQLNVGGCSRVTNESAKALAAFSKHLESVNLSRTKVTDEGIIALAEGVCSGSLKEIHLSHCSGIRDIAIEQLVSRCPNLQILIFVGCPMTTSRSREAVQAMMYQMRQVSWTIY